MNWDTFRLARLSFASKLTITLFLLIVGPGYLFGTANILLKHQNADGEPGLTIDDLRATFHGMTKTFKPEDKRIVTSAMLKQILPGGEMREYLEQGGDPAVRALTKWLENAALKEEFTKAGLVEAGDPTPQQVIQAQCIECHNSDGGDMEEIPYAADAEAEPEYELVMATAKPDIKIEESGEQTIEIKPTSTARLVHITHVHIFTVPMFTFLVAVLFLMTGVPQGLKTLLAPLPLLAVFLDIGGWWAARYFEPFIYVIGAAGGLHGSTYALQIVCILWALWLGKRE